MILMDLRNRPDMRAQAQAVTVLTVDEPGGQHLNVGRRGGDTTAIRPGRQISASSAASRPQSDGSTTRSG